MHNHNRFVLYGEKEYMPSTGFRWELSYTLEWNSDPDADNSEHKIRVRSTTDASYDDLEQMLTEWHHIQHPKEKGRAAGIVAMYLLHVLERPS